MLYGDNTPRPSYTPPDFAKFKEKGAKFFRRGAGAIVLVVLAAILLANGLYTVNSGEEAVLLRFGSYEATVQSPGLHLKIPFADTAQVVNVEAVRRQEFGFRSNAAPGSQLLYNASPAADSEFVEAESLMLTGDENLVNADWAILYKVSSSYNFLYKVQHPETTLRIISESAYRRVVASHPLDDVLTDKKDEIQREIMADLQEICNKYEIGIQITGVQLQDAMPPAPVRPSFLEVTSAKEERQSKINEAMTYAQDRLPVARGEAAKQINDAEGYKQRRINEAVGAVARYRAIEAEYASNPDIMRTRLYLEMIREVLPRVKNVYFVNEGGEMVKFLPLGPSSVLPQ